MGLFGNIAGIVNGFQGASAVSNAANEQIKGYQQSANTVDRTVAGINPTIAGAYRQAGDSVLDASNGAATGVLNAAQAAGAGVNQAAGQANEFLNPYMQNGANAATSLNAMFAPGGEGTRNFTAADLELDPSYQFRIEEGQKALQRAGAVSGSTHGGAALKSLTRYAQGVASTEYGAAFDRYNQQQNSRFNRLNSMVGTGLQASGAAGQNLTGAATYTGNIGVTGEQLAGNYRTNGQTYASNAALTGVNRTTTNEMQAGLFRAGAEGDIADARAGEHLGRSNAWAGAINSAGQAADGFIAAGNKGGNGFKLKDAFGFGSKA